MHNNKSTRQQNIFEMSAILNMNMTVRLEYEKG